jgi:serine/threonine protein kinase
VAENSLSNSLIVHVQVEDRFFIYLEYVHPGSINKYIRDHCGTMTESVVRNFTRHILSGLAYLHNKKTVHRDIKGANLLVDASGVVKLADFGMAKHLTGQRADLSLKGSPYWMAPELMQAVMQKDSNPDLAFAVDIWSLGCTIIEMFTGKPPWSEFEGAAAMFKVMRDSPPIPESMSPEGKDFLRLCFQRNPAERPTASMLLEHRFLKNSLQPTSPSNSDVSQLFNGMNITEPSSRREKPNFKLDQVPRARNMTSSESESGQQQQQQQYRSPDLTGTVNRLSPRSTLEAIPSPCPSQRPKPSSSDRRRTGVTSDHL